MYRDKGSEDNNLDLHINGRFRNLKKDPVMRFKMTTYPDIPSRLLLHL